MNKLTLADLYAMKLYLEADNKESEEAMRQPQADIPDIKRYMYEIDLKLDRLNDEIRARITVCD